MTQLFGDVANRVMRLPKPSSIGDALQPIFEAVSNSIHAINDRFKDAAKERGQIVVEFHNLRDPILYRVAIEDNGIGLDTERFKAFCTTDTPFKIERGGKGVGRLLWLDAFERIRIASTFESAEGFVARSFDFGLGYPEPIFNEEVSQLSGTSEAGTSITMTGLRGNSYASNMPVQFTSINRHFASHFLADFLLNNSPKITVISEGSEVVYPAAVESLLIGPHSSLEHESTKYGSLKIDGFILKKEASRGFDGDHHLHLVSSGRTVQTRKIDGLLGVKRFGDDFDSVFHACLSGGFLDERVNQERTQFNFSEEVADEITKEVVDKIKATILKPEVETYETYRLGKLNEFLDDNPSFGFDSASSLLSMTPVNADNNEAFAAALVKHKVRRDQDRKRRLQSVLTRLYESDTAAPSLTAEIELAASEASADENRQLMEYILRRKFIIEIMDALLGKVRTLSGKFDTHLESTFHQLICPMQVVGTGPYRTTPVSHDLWLLDERLAPAVYFASDARVEEFIEDGGSDRVDLMVWDKIHGLGH